MYVRRVWPCVATSAVALCTCRRDLLHCSVPRHGLEQVQDVPTSTSRKPPGMHRGPGKRQTSPSEAAEYQFVRRWDLRMRDAWDELEPFKGLPKPKVQFGNEAAEVVWPYAMLLERVVRVHPFTKSIYVYYSQRQATMAGRRAAAMARAFAREFLVPITFHNAHVYTEAEMLLEYSETPWFVVHCLDGRHVVRPIAPLDTTATTSMDAATATVATTTTTTTTIAAHATCIDDVNAAEHATAVTMDANAEEAAAATAADVQHVLGCVVAACDALGSSAANAKELTRVLNERPLQNQYLRINYQWYGDTPEERMSHLVQWTFASDGVTAPLLRNRKRHLLHWLNNDGNLPPDAALRANVHREAHRLRKPQVGGVQSFYNSANARADARTPRFGGRAPST